MKGLPIKRKRIIEKDRFDFNLFLAVYAYLRYDIMLSSDCSLGWMMLLFLKNPSNLFFAAIQLNLTFMRRLLSSGSV
jgi:hypothetical protein